MKRRPGSASDASNLSKDELRVLAKVDLAIPVDIALGGALKPGYLVSITQSAVLFQKGADVVEVQLTDVTDVVWDYATESVRLEGGGVEIRSPNHATKSAVRRIILAMLEVRVPPPPFGRSGGSGTAPHHHHQQQQQGAERTSSDWQLHDSPYRPDANASGYGAAADNVILRDQTPRSPASDGRLGTPVSTAVPPPGGLQNYQQQQQQQQPEGALPSSPIAGIGSGPGGGAAMKRQRLKTTSTLGDARSLAATPRQGSLLQDTAPSERESISRSVHQRSVVRDEPSVQVNSVQQPQQTSVGGRGGGGGGGGGVPGTYTHHHSPQRERDESSFAHVNAPPSQPLQQHLRQQQQQQQQPASQGASLRRPESIAPSSASGGYNHVNDTPQQLQLATMKTASSLVVDSRRGGASAGGGATKGFPPATASHWVVSSVAPLDKMPFDYFGPLSDVPVRVVDLVAEPPSERGKLLLVIGEDVAGNAAVAVYNGHPEVELHVETWVTGDIRAGPGVETAVHPQYNAPVFCITVQPGETLEFICGKMKEDPQPGWKTQPLSEDSFAKRRKAKEAVVFEDYQRLQNRVDGDASEVEVLERAAAERLPFVDLWFLPQPSSLAKPFEVTNGTVTAGKYDDVDAWGRPSSYLPPGQTGVLFCSKPAPNDIDMGFFGNAWLPCCLSALAEVAVRRSGGGGGGSAYSPVAEMFAKHRAEYAEMGGYRVVMSKDGWWREAAIDSYLPLIRYPKRSLLDIPAFAHNIGQPREVWVGIAEKAYARLCGSYAAISTGYFHEGLMDLTGFPAERLRWVETKDSTLFEDMVQQQREGNLLLIHTPTPSQPHVVPGGAEVDKEKTYAQNGLMLGYAYTVLDVCVADGHKMVRIRNPWPNGGRWGGRWAEGSKAWTTCPGVAARLNYSGDDDGSVWLAWPEVLDWFCGGTLLHLLPDAGELRLAVPFSNGPAFVTEVQVNTPTRVYIGVHLKDQKGRPNPLPYGCMNVTILQNNKPDETCQWQRLQEDYEWGSKDFLGVYEFLPEDGTYLVCVHDYDGGAEGGNITEDIIVTMHYQPLRSDGPSVEGVVSMKEASPVLEAIKYNPVFIREKLQPAEAFVQVRRHIASQAQPTQHQLVTTVQL